MNKFVRSTLTLFLLFNLSACNLTENQPRLDSPIEQQLQATSTFVSISTPTATLQPPPGVLVSEGDYYLFLGDFQTAQTLFLKIISQTDDPIIQTQAQLGLGLAFLNQEETSTALGYFRQASQSFDLTTASRAQYLLGETYTQLQRYEDALIAYQTYLETRPGLIDEHVYELIGDIYITLGDASSAAASYQQAYLAHHDGGTDALAVKIARAYQSNGDVETALSLYWDIYNTSTNDYTKAQMALFIANIYLSQGQQEQAFDIFHESVENYPFAYDAYTALAILVDNDVPVNEYYRGLINYYVGNYLLAIQAFDRYIESDEGEFADAV